MKGRGKGKSWGRGKVLAERDWGRSECLAPSHSSPSSSSSPFPPEHQLRMGENERNGGDLIRDGMLLDRWDNDS